MKKVINVGIDLDGVCCNFAKRYSEVCRNLFGEKCPIIQNESEILGWVWYDWYPINKDEWNKAWDSIRSTHNFWTTLEPIQPNQFFYMRDRIMNEPYINTYFITAREPSVGLSIAKQSIEWLESNGWKNPQVLEIQKKGPAIQALGISHFIDDKTENILSAIAESDAYTYAPNIPHNKKLDSILSLGRFSRVEGLKDFTDKLMSKL